VKTGGGSVGATDIVTLLAKAGFGALWQKLSKDREFMRIVPLCQSGAAPAITPFSARREEIRPLLLTPSHTRKRKKP
jgi:hypothetical protein